MIVAFITVLLGLTAGSRTIEVAVAEPVTRIEILLDGASAGVITDEPWSLEVDLGAELEPHRLVAVARDRAGAELGRAEQWINLPHEPVEAQLRFSPAVEAVAEAAFGGVFGEQVATEIQALALALGEGARLPPCE